MYKTQSFSSDFTVPREPLINVNDNMKVFSRPVFQQLTKNSFQPYKVFTPSVAALQKHSDSVAVQNNCSSANDGKPKQKLLRFPAMPLKDTLERFRKSAEPFLTKAEMKETDDVMHDFYCNAGEDMQKLLEEVAKKEENWLAGRWLRTAYMQYRDPVTVFSSPGMAFPLQTFECDEAYTLYAAKLIYNLIRYKELIDNGEIPIVKMGKLELDNSQFEKVFGTCRIPKRSEDYMEYNPKSKHIVIVYKNHFYKFRVYNMNGELMHPAEISKELQTIMASETKKGLPFGILTTDKRDNWAESYNELMTSPKSGPSIDVIQKSLFTVSLDDSVPSTDENKYHIQSAQLIHGGGNHQNSGNRWMDKTIQVIVNRNGMSGFTYEHSPAEGQPIALMSDYVVKNLNDEKFYECGSHEGLEPAEKLCFDTNISDCLTIFLKAAILNVDLLANKLQTHVLHYKRYGKGFLKQQKLSPDSYIQMAIQLAFYTMHKVPGAQYESAHLRIYYGGRTETIRSCSNESIAFAKAMLNEEECDENRVELLRKAVNGHRAYTTLALQGRGVDRHLLGLKLMALENKKPVHNFYKTPGVVKSSHFRLSTSQVASANESYMCYGPLTEDGYGCCYNPRENDMIFAISAWKQNKETCADQFATALCNSLLSMKKLLENHGVKPTSKL